MSSSHGLRQGQLQRLGPGDRRERTWGLGAVRALWERSGAAGASQRVRRLLGIGAAPGVPRPPVQPCFLHAAGQGISCLLGNLRVPLAQVPAPDTPGSGLPPPPHCLLPPPPPLPGHHSASGTASPLTPYQDPGPQLCSPPLPPCDQLPTSHGLGVSVARTFLRPSPLAPLCPTTRASPPGFQPSKGPHALCP